ncbi:MAG: MFS transporter, partial [Firmicutes bacterium]|nr:MFS transporter [Bacillota bacterium]
MRLDYRRTLILGFGFFAISLSWALYNAFVPVFLDTLLVDVAMKGFLVGAIMTFDNIAAVTLQPFFGAASDRTWNRYGRRMPYILVGMPLGALFFALIPAFRSHLYALIVVLVLMNVSMTVFRAP